MLTVSCHAKEKVGLFCRPPTGILTSFIKYPAKKILCCADTARYLLHAKINGIIKTTKDYKQGVIQRSKHRWQPSETGSSWEDLCIHREIQLELSIHELHSWYYSKILKWEFYTLSRGKLSNIITPHTMKLLTVDSMDIDLVSVAVDTHQTLKLIPIVIRNLKPTNIQILDFTSTPGETLKVILTEETP